MSKDKCIHSGFDNLKKKIGRCRIICIVPPFFIGQCKKCKGWFKYSEFTPEIENVSKREGEKLFKENTYH